MVRVHPALNTASVSVCSVEMRWEGWQSRCGWRKRRSAGRWPSGVCVESAVPRLSSWWSEVWLEGTFSGLEVNKAMDDFVHHLGLGHCLAVTERLQMESRDKIRGTCTDG